MNLFETKIKSLFYPTAKGLHKIQPIMAEKNLVLADVGSTGGLDKNWWPLKNILQIYSFDPDERAKQDKDSKICFPVALWSSEKYMNLHMTKFPPASSLKIPNREVLDIFSNAKDHDIVNKKTVKVVKMDDALSSYDPPDFIKIDAEGADFEIMKGAEKILRKACLGLQVEVQFIERNKSSVKFGTIDKYLQDRGFSLITLRREFWLRKNLKWGPWSQAQIIWADAIYLISEKEFIKSLNQGQAEKNAILTTKLVLICLAYGAHDYAHDVVTTVQDKNLIEDDVSKKLKQFVDENIVSSTRAVTTDILRLILALMIYFASLFLFKYKTKASTLLRLAAAKLFKTGFMICSRTGEKKNLLADNY